jgi:predicted short-subunit dehydrogenase-like oxidoreductase (DUF2520 family)
MTSENAESVVQLADPLTGPCDIVGRGRMGQALTAALDRAGVDVRGPFGRGATGEGAAVVLLCVPDREIGAASAIITGDAIVGHVSASAPLALLEPHERFVMHPLISVAFGETRFAGVTCAVDGSSPRATAVAVALAERIGMRPRVVEPSLRAVYHAAASTAANYVTTTLGMAERLASAAGIDRTALMPLVQSAVTLWLERGAHDALTGPIARGDEITVARQRAGVAAEAPDLLPLWDALVQATRALAAQRAGRDS